MEGIEEATTALLEFLAFSIELIAGAILVFGAARFLFTVAVQSLSGSRGMSEALADARVHLGAYILAGLEFLIVADILFTIVNRSLEDVIVLAIIASVRTLISVFLNRELKELRQQGVS
ncbi:DUF1622 domain-containing protein [Parvularcula lutaonensis]|uniref:DUF1622 domain-containing protein n=1 Tax=Parvularcula lutaonensis TaxID=491923 RepID=A0ABV7M9P7_9PROT|nr:DUF1622 domain-containing protein [Parvularcula lutaonensis]GGY47013.1 hypothetical protein GCM10007148_15300 [Parvularcula lutaonensis]